MASRSAPSQSRNQAGKGAARRCSCMRSKVPGVPHGLDIVRALAADSGRVGSALTGWLVWAKLERSARTHPAAHQPPPPRWRHDWHPYPATSGSSRPSTRWTTILDGHRLRQVRNQHALSRDQLADRAGISRAIVARPERHPVGSCRSRTLARLAAPLGKDPVGLTPAGQPPERPHNLQSPGCFPCVAGQGRARVGERGLPVAGQMGIGGSAMTQAWTLSQRHPAGRV